jgi:hypothetical protein
MADRERRRTRAVGLVRVGLPVAIGGAGAVLTVLGDEAARGAGVLLMGVAVLVIVANALIRLALQSESERDLEERRRRFFDEHGHWPDEPPPPDRPS